MEFVYKAMPLPAMGIGLLSSGSASSSSIQQQQQQQGHAENGYSNPPIETLTSPSSYVNSYY